MIIDLSQGKLAEIDDDDIDLVSLFRWYAYESHGNWYAAANSPMVEGDSITLYLHRFVLGLQVNDHRFVDHRDGSGLNNRKENLRIATNQQNSWNRRANRNSTSKYKGVSWHRYPSGNGNGKWRAQITVDGKKYRLGLFDNEADAALACDALMIKLHGEFARLNFPLVGK